MTADPIKSYFQKLCEVGERLLKISVDHRSRPCVVDVRPTSHFNNLFSGATAIFYTAFTLENTAVVDWIINIDCEPQWEIVAGIRLYRSSFEENIGDLGEWTTSDSNEINAILDQAIAYIEESIRTFDFCRYSLAFRSCTG